MGMICRAFKRVQNRPEKATFHHSGCGEGFGKDG
jgi:hypothetical protein